MKRVEKTINYKIIALSFAIVIFIGSILLYLPCSHHGKIAVVDAVFTAASALCVTGLTVVDTGKDFTRMGQIVILVLIQLGGLGIMTFATLFLLGGRTISLRRRTIVVDTMTHGDEKDIATLIKGIFLFTFLVELIGTALLFIRWQGDLPAGSAAYTAVFHSISAFCNAGFSLYSNSLENFRGDVAVNIIFMGLIVLGGLGFLVNIELWKRIFPGAQRRKKSFSLHTRLTLLTTVLLIVAGTVLIFLLEYKPEVPLKESILVSVFQSITPRTAGFNTFPIQDFTNPTLFFILLFMFIGASPGSTGGGIKTTTFAVLMNMIKGRLEGSEKTRIWRRTVPEETISRVILILTLGLLSVGLSVLLILLFEEYHFTDKDFFLHVLFETTSAFGTVGLSTGITAKLATSSKIVLIFLMYIGRVGPLTLALALRTKEKAVVIDYPKENIIVG